MEIFQTEILTELYRATDISNQLAIHSASQSSSLNFKDIHLFESIHSQNHFKPPQPPDLRFKETTL